MLGIVSKESDFKPTFSFRKEVLAKWLAKNEVPTRYHTPYFAHIWAEGIQQDIRCTPVKTLDYNAS
jgi:peptidyl-dipeptidase Dcp